MKTAIITGLFAILVSVTGSAQSHFNEGLKWYHQRYSDAIGIQAKTEHVDKAIYHFEKALESTNQEADVVIYLMRCYNFKGRFVMESQRDKRRIHQLAKELGDRYVSKYPRNKEMRFQYLSALGQWGDSMDVFRAAKEGVVDLVKEQMEALIRLDPEFRNGIGERALAILNLRVPRIPFILSWPNKEKALQMTNDVVNRYPDDMGNNFYHAEALLANGKKEEARNYLVKALSMSLNNKYLLEERQFQIKAKKMLERLEKKR